MGMPVTWLILQSASISQTFPHQCTTMMQRVFFVIALRTAWPEKNLDANQNKQDKHSKQENLRKTKKHRSEETNARAKPREKKQRHSQNGNK